MVEVSLDGVFEREYWKLMSAISAGFGAGETPEDAEGSRREASERGRRGEQALSRVFYI
jgi:hypothetical protein